MLDYHTSTCTSYMRVKSWRWVTLLLVLWEKKLYFHKFFNFRHTKVFVLFRIWCYSKNKTCEEFCYLSNDYFSIFFYQDLICQFDNCLTVCSLNMKGMIISYFPPNNVSIIKLLFLTNEIYCNNPESLFDYDYNFQSNGWILWFLEFF